MATSSLRLPAICVQLDPARPPIVQQSALHLFVADARGVF
jgi:hypothetical protein